MLELFNPWHLRRLHTEAQAELLEANMYLEDLRRQLNEASNLVNTASSALFEERAKSARLEYENLTYAREIAEVKQLNGAFHGIRHIPARLSRVENLAEDQLREFTFEIPAVSISTPLSYAADGKTPASLHLYLAALTLRTWAEASAEKLAVALKEYFENE